MGKFNVLSRYHLRKNKGQYVSFSIIVLIATMILGVGLVTVLNFGKMYEDKFETYNCADVYYTLFNNDWSEEFYKNATSLTEVKAEEMRENIMLSGDATYAENGNTMNHIFFNADEKHEMNTLKVVGDSIDINRVKNPIYISYWIKANGCKVGDIYKFVSGDKTYEFTIVGFVEDLMYGNNNCANMGVYLPEKDFQAMYKSVPESAHAKTLALRLYRRDDGKKVYNNLSKMLAGNLRNTYNFNYGYYEMSQRNRTATANILASMFVAFSALLVIITMLVINFRIKSSVQEEMQNMGVMTAMGYTSKQVIWSIAIPYLALGAISMILGIVASYLFLPLVQSVLEKLAGLMWRQSLDLLSLGIVIVVILGLILITTLFSARKIKKLHPIETLRSGIKHHSFKKNYFPLEKSRVSVNITLGLKAFISNIKQYIFLFIIIVVSAFTLIFMSSGLYNSTVKPDNFVRVISEENPTITLNANTKTDADEIIQALKQDDRVENALFYSISNLIIGDETISVFVIDDYDQLTNDICYKGRHPKHNNEVGIGCTLADSLGVEIGDKIKIKSSTKEEEYLIVGLIQAPDYDGSVCEMTSVGYKKISDNFEQLAINVYLKDGDTSAAYTEEIAIRYKDQLAGYCDYKTMLDAVYENFIPLMVMVVAVVTVVDIVLIIVVLYMIIKTVVSHRKQELGISKALGYTTRQLILQMAYSLCPAIGLGAIVGGILGFLYTHNLWLLCFYGLGIRKVTLGVPGLWVLVIVVFMIVFATLVAVLISRRIKKISAIKLIKE